MKIRTQRKKCRGSAVVVAVILLGIMATLIVGNSVALHNLKRDLILLEKKQLKNSLHFGSTNSPPAHEPGAKTN